MIIQEARIANLHAGPPLLAYILKQSYWIVGAKILSRKIVNKCVVCCSRKVNFLTDDPAKVSEASGRDFGKGGTMSTYIPFNKEPSGGSLKRISELETWSS
ncbi:hypothetical protein CDAR_368801 [Caerostris darwini]|uniref:Uncharacterized protein n=1 Tax=Caerostris darwini TaxID=1538125 RepID=A0AAV4X062_9ARAC|nr:hypothetical protein CDAR_368801 [Caerostris darwini]